MDRKRARADGKPVGTTRRSSFRASVQRVAREMPWLLAVASLSALLAVFVYVLLFVVLFPVLFVLGISIPGPWGPPLDVLLPQGGKVIFQSRGQNLNEMEKRLTWITPGGQKHDFTIDSTHGGGYDVVEIRIADDNRAVWLVDHTPSVLRWTESGPRETSDSVTMAALDLTTAEFWDEWSFSEPYSPSRPQWATPTTGRSLGLMFPLGWGGQWTQDIYGMVICRSPDAASSPNTRLRWFHSTSRRVGRADYLMLETTASVYRTGEWRAASDYGCWLVDRQQKGNPRVVAVFDRIAGLFHDEHGIVWNIPDKPGEPPRKLGDQPQPYPKWATPTLGKLITPWKVW